MARYLRLIARVRRIAANPYLYLNQGDRDALEHAARVIEKLTTPTADPGQDPVAIDGEARRIAAEIRAGVVDI